MVTGGLTPSAPLPTQCQHHGGPGAGNSGLWAHRPALAPTPLLPGHHLCPSAMCPLGQGPVRNPRILAAHFLLVLPTGQAGLGGWAQGLGWPASVSHEYLFLAALAGSAPGGPSASTYNLSGTPEARMSTGSQRWGAGFGEAKRGTAGRPVQVRAIKVHVLVPSSPTHQKWKSTRCCEWLSARL